MILTLRKKIARYAAENGNKAVSKFSKDLGYSVQKALSGTLKGPATKSRERSEFYVITKCSN